MHEVRDILTAHGGRIDAAAELYPAAPQPWIDLSTGINPHPYPVPPVEPALWQRLPLARDLDDLVAAATAYYGQPEQHAPAAGARQRERHPPVAAAGARPPRRHRRPDLFVPRRRRGAPPAAASPSSTPCPIPPPTSTAWCWSTPTIRTAAAIPAAELLDWAAAWTAAGRWLVVDEAFADVDPEVSLLAQPALPPRIVVLRSLGKFFGLAGLRLGFIACSERVAARWQPLVGDWPVSGPAAAIGTAALGDAAWIAGTRQRLAADRQRLDALLAEAGFAVLGGTDLFRLAEIPERLAGDVDPVDHFARRGILVRGFAVGAAPRPLRPARRGGRVAPAAAGLSRSSVNSMPQLQRRSVGRNRAFRYEYSTRFGDDHRRPKSSLSQIHPYRPAIRLPRSPGPGRHRKMTAC